VEDVRFYNLTDWLCYFIGLNSTTQLNLALCDFFKQEFNSTLYQDTIVSPTVDINYYPAFKLLSRLYVRLMQSKDTSFLCEKVDTLHKLIQILDSNSNLKEELLDKLVCFPNQNYLLKSQGELKMDLVVEHDFKKKYFDITGVDCKNDLVLTDFNVFLQHKDSVTGVQLGDQIEKTLNKDKLFMPVVAEHLNTLLDLIKYISINPVTWGNWLPNIDKVKEEVLMYKFQDQKTRTSLFSILSEDEAKINLLGELASIPNLQALIDAGRDKQKEQYRKDKHLEYIGMIGLLVQDLIQKEINKSLNDAIALVNSSRDEKLKTVEEQNGQDFIIYKDSSPIYYIEVKSRWDTNGIVALSKRQVECCAKNPGIYAVITVNVADYKSRKDFKMDDISFEELFEDIYVNVDLSEEFEILIRENNQYEKILENGKLIEFRGHIPQERIKNKGIKFTEFIENLKLILIESYLIENLTDS
jgi:hypothetical protein